MILAKLPCVRTGRLVTSGCYNARMSATAEARVSHRGQTSLPAEIRHRWGISAGGEVGIIDLGDAALIVPGGLDVARKELHKVLLERYDGAVGEIDDPDLADQ